MLKLGDRVQIRYGVMYKGNDLTYEKGIVKSLESYVEVYIPSMGVTAKLFQYEVELCKTSLLDDIDTALEDISKLFS